MLTKIVDTILPTTGWSGRIRGQAGIASSCLAVTSGLPLRRSATKRPTRTPPRFVISRAGGSRSGHRHRRPDVVRRLRRRHRLVLLVHVTNEFTASIRPRSRILPRSAPRFRTKDVELLADWGGVVNSGAVKRGPIRLTDLYKIAARTATKPIKVSVGAGPVNLAWHVYFQHYKGRSRAQLRAGPHLQCGDEGPGCRRREIPAKLRTSAPGCRCLPTTRTTTSGSPM